ncbi:MAG: hypothetical protein ACI4RA_10630 [Kiritimatiellia bacterium]
MAVTLPKVYGSYDSGPTGSTNKLETSYMPLDEYHRGGEFGWSSGRRLNAQATAGAAANIYRQHAEDALAQSQNTLNTAYGNLKDANNPLRSALDGIINGDAGIDGYLQLATQNYGKINQYAEEAKAAADDITNSVADVRKNATDITNTAAALGEYEPLLRQMGETMFGEGSGLVDSGSNYIDTGLSILGLDKSAGGLAGTYAQVLAAMDPSLAVSMAANDTRSAFEKQTAANERAAARRGVSAGSGQSAATLQQAGQALATSLAAIKTKTRMDANKSFFEAMRGAVADANALGSTGASIVTQGVNAQGAGADAVKSAAGILVNKGQLQSSAAQANVSAGNLRAAQANALTAAGQLTTAGGNLALGAANAVNGATANRINAANVFGNLNNAEFGAAAKVADGQNTAASYYAGMFNQYAQLAGSRYLFAS